MNDFEARADRLLMIAAVLLISGLVGLWAAYQLSALSEQSQWIAFWGSLIGGAAGGVGAFLGVLATLRRDRDRELHRRAEEISSLRAVLGEELLGMAVIVDRNTRHVFHVAKTKGSIEDVSLQFRRPIVFHAMTGRLDRLHAADGRTLIRVYAQLSRIDALWDRLVHSKKGDPEWMLFPINFAFYWRRACQLFADALSQFGVDQDTSEWNEAPAEPPYEKTLSATLRVLANTNPFDRISKNEQRDATKSND